MKRIKKTKQMEEEIKIALKYADSIIATLREPFLVINKNLRVISANQSFYTTFKVTKKETIGQLLPNLGNGQWNIPKLIRLLKEILLQQTAVTNYEVEHEFKTIGHRIMNLNACQLRIPKKIAKLITEEEEEEEEELILLAIEDTTEREKAEKTKIKVATLEKELEQQKEFEKLRMDFLSLASHQLRTPLSGTKWLIETMYRGILGEMTKKQKEYLDEIYKINERMIKLISDILDTLRLESEDTLVKKEKISVASLSKDVLVMATAAAKERKIELQSPLNQQTLTIETDPEILKSILGTFLSNAISYSMPGQKVIFDVREQSGAIVFFIRDFGIGIPQNEQKRMFERFYRASSAKNLQVNGSGLGLNIAKTLAGKIGAEISFESEENKGSTFYLRIPKSSGIAKEE